MGNVREAGILSLEKQNAVGRDTRSGWRGASRMRQALWVTSGMLGFILMIVGLLRGYEWRVAEPGEKWMPGRYK